LVKLFFYLHNNNVAALLCISESIVVELALNQMKLFIYTVLFIFINSSVLSQNYTISGYVSDVETGEKLISAYVYDQISQKGTVTNNYGFYSLTLPKDSVKIIYSYLGYESKEKILFLNENLELEIKLFDKNQMKEIEITGKRISEKNERIEEKTQMSRVEIPINQIKAIPTIFGETDVLKILQLLPGIQTGTEGTSGLYVRGGSPDQNLILLDNVPVYNISHFLGIFSIFNADALKNVSITKGGFPARYGGRLSSIIEISMKDGNVKKFHGAGSIGNLTSKLMLEGPIIKDKASFIISGRRSYMDLFLRPIIKKSSNGDQDVALYFYDINAKVNYKLNDKNRVYLSFYSGKDLFGIKLRNSSEGKSSGNNGEIKWGNIIAGMRWNSQLSSKLFLNSTLTYSKYNSNFDAENSIEDKSISQKFIASYNSGIEDLSGKLDFDFIPSPSNFIKFGASYITHSYNPGAISFLAENSGYLLDTLIGYNKALSDEYYVYGEDDFSFGAFKANIGIHYSGFKTENKTYTSLQPRFGLRVLLNNSFAIKASYATMNQYINLLTSESISTPLDLWVPSTEKVKPQFSSQIAFGIANTFRNNFEISIEGYYKEMENVISYTPGESFFSRTFGETDWENKIVQGAGESYGLEVLLQKKKGRFSGWIAYTLAWNWRQFDEINGGEKYHFKYDRRHDFAIVSTYILSKNITLSGSWIYSTGNAVTIPIFKYSYPSSVNDFFHADKIESLGEKNAFRMSDTHRLDVSIEFHKKRKRWERTWVIGVYNAYFHKNPFFIYTEYDVKKGERVFKELSILPILPSISYRFKF